jgi:uncharacterized protein DUF2249
MWKEKVETMANEQPSETAVHSTEIRLDVRPLLAAGEEPFGVIMSAIEQVPPGGVLVLDAPFDPAPLRQLLGSSSRGIIFASASIDPAYPTRRWRRSLPTMSARGSGATSTGFTST